MKFRGIEITRRQIASGKIANAQRSTLSFGVGEAKAGVHSGEWEMSLMLWLRPEQVKMNRATEGFVGELTEVLSRVFDGIENLDKNGVLGDPRPASAEAGKQYMEDIMHLFDHWFHRQDLQ